MGRDYYDVLGVPRDADAKAIKHAFRSLTLQLHPDRNKEPGAAERFREVVEAYAVLSDPAKRSAYDARGVSDASTMSLEDLLGGLDLGDVFGGADLGGLGGAWFERVFGGRPAARAPWRGRDLEVAVPVPLDLALTGGDRTVTVTRPVPCGSCHGSRAKAGTTPKPCAACGGSGQKVESRREGPVLFRQLSPCSACGATGTIVEAPCDGCGGRGVVEERESLSIKIPAGIEDGMRLRVPGHGAPASAPGAPPGDLFVRVDEVRHERLVRRGADLVCEVPLEVPDAVLGASASVPTLEGPVSVKVPPGVQPGTVLRLRERGLPRLGHAGRGDLYVELRVHVPERVTPEQAALYEKLRAATGAAEPRAVRTS